MARVTHVIHASDLPPGCIGDCSHAGACDEDVSFWLCDRVVASLLNEIPPKDVRICLRRYGAWSAEDLSDDEENLARILWLMCGDFRSGMDIFAVE